MYISCSSNSDNLDTLTSTSNSDYEIEILKLINQHRKSKELLEFEILEIIKSQTDEHTDYMIAQGKISHDNFNQRADYLKNKANAMTIAENVASGYSSAEAVVNGWLNSEGHRKNIEGNYSHFNLTAKKNKNGSWYYTNIFIRK
ncbi:CAP domain-containing protein [Tenacibaculum sediminilitoris]|uniref:CAP domain-containing protein n=1 Tax=Tenacibaculum sediminilitoris TaxID=1820334 RepID=UPI0038B55A42